MPTTVRQLHNEELRPSKRQRLESDSPELQSWYFSSDEREEDFIYSFERQPTFEPDAILDHNTSDHTQLFDFGSYYHCDYDADAGTSENLHTESESVPNICENSRLIHDAASTTQSSRPNLTVGQDESDRCISLVERSQQEYTQCNDEALGALQMVSESSKECFGMVSELS